MKSGCSIVIFLNSANLICRSTDISKCFSGSLRFRDNESRLYLNMTFVRIHTMKRYIKKGKGKNKEVSKRKGKIKGKRTGRREKKKEKKGKERLHEE